jgi:hypothetical protein
MTEQTTLTPIEAINEFYRLKDKYESGYYEKYVKPIIRSNKSKREKRVEYSKLPKHECINCKRNVGTIFNVKVDKKEYMRFFSAKCGDVQDPCPLEIQINYSSREQMNKHIREGLTEIEKIKLDIIKEKNNSLFFHKNVVDVFNKLTQDLKIETENTGFVIETNILRNDNPEKTVLLRQAIDEFGKGFILPFKQMVKEFDETNNELILNQAVNFYINEMVPKLKEIQSLKYDVSMVEYDEANNIYNLVQLPNSLESNEYYYKDDDKIIKFVRGTKKEKKKTRKDDSEFKPKNKTRKIKPIVDLVLEDEEEEIIEPGEEIIEEQLESKYADEPNKKPIFDESGNVTWNNEEYDKVWRVMPSELKNLLIQDHDWLEDYMNNCIKLRKQRKPCELFIPKQTKFPPVKDANGKFDFGSDIINKLFNSLSESYQDTLLTLYSEKDGVKSYNMLKDTLASLLAQKINLQRAYF